MNEEQSNIVSLIKEEDECLEPSLPLIEWLENALEEAKTGRLRGIAGACQYNDECTYHLMGWAGGFEMLGALQTAMLVQAGGD